MTDQTRPTMLSRRSFMTLALRLGISAAVLETLIQLPGQIHIAQGSRGQSAVAHKWIMVIDLGACTGCNFCSYACKATNDTPTGITWNAVFQDKTVTSQKVYIPRPCMHCENAPCVDVCPVGATTHREDGLVVTDYGKCIGCRYCQVACPYGARYFNWAADTQPNPVVPEWGTPEVERRPRGVVEKCTFCAHRIDAGLERGLVPGLDPGATPACVTICPVGARYFGDADNPGSKVSRLLATRESVRLREALGVNPRVYYLLPERKV